MKAADVAGILVVLLLAAAGAGGFFYMKAENDRVEAAHYEAAIDYITDSSIRTARLSAVQAELAHSQDRLQALRALYADPERIDVMNLGFSELRSQWTSAYSHLAEEQGRAIESGRLQREVDERFGSGAYALMSANYEQYAANAPQRAAELAEQQRQKNLEFARALDDYQRRHGHLPTGGFRVENGRVVELP